MTRHSTLHAPAAGIRLAWSSASTVVIDPGPDEHTRTSNLVRERCLVAVAVVLTVTGLVMLHSSKPYERPWLAAAALLLTTAVVIAARPRRRRVPASLVDLLDPMRASEPSEPSEIHRLVWEAAELIRSAEALDDAPACPACTDRLEKITVRLGVLARPAHHNGVTREPVFARAPHDLRTVDF